jgi:hypothetical protein
MHVWEFAHGRTRVHGLESCEGLAFCFHNPSAYPMCSALILLRRGFVIERQCIYGVGRPDPDLVPYLADHDKTDRNWGAHECNGCCQR